MGFSKLNCCGCNEGDQACWRWTGLVRWINGWCMCRAKGISWLISSNLLNVLNIFLEDHCCYRFNKIKVMETEFILLEVEWDLKLPFLSTIREDWELDQGLLCGQQWGEQNVLKFYFFKLKSHTLQVNDARKCPCNHLATLSRSTWSRPTEIMNYRLTGSALWVCNVAFHSKLGCEYMLIILLLFQ